MGGMKLAQSKLKRTFWRSSGLLTAQKGDRFCFRPLQFLPLVGVITRDMRKEPGAILRSRSKPGFPHSFVQHAVFFSNMLHLSVVNMLHIPFLSPLCLFGCFFFFPHLQPPPLPPAPPKLGPPKTARSLLFFPAAHHSPGGLLPGAHPASLWLRPLGPPPNRGGVVGEGEGGPK